MITISMILISESIQGIVITISMILISESIVYEYRV